MSVNFCKHRDPPDFRKGFNTAWFPSRENERGFYHGHICLSWKENILISVKFLVVLLLWCFTKHILPEITFHFSVNLTLLCKKVKRWRCSTYKPRNVLRIQEKSNRDTFQFTQTIWAHSYHVLSVCCIILTECPSSRLVFDSNTV